MAAIAWLPWCVDAFARAGRDGKPVLLSIVASWCRYSDEMDRTSFAHERVARIVADRFVPVRVDADRRPDVSARYLLGGVPTTAFLTPDGAVIGGGTYVPSDRLADVLERVHRAFVDGRHVVEAGRTPESTDEPTRMDEQRLMQLALDALARSLDESGPIAPSLVRLALQQAAAGREELRDAAVQALDALGWGERYDEQDGGFFRSAANAHGATSEKLLDTNAAMLGLYTDAFDVLRLARYAERAEGILRFVQAWLADPAEGGWSAAQKARSTEAADREGAAPVDHTLYSDWNAMMASAALRAGEVMNDTDLSRFGLQSLERVALLSYRPGAGVAHFHDGVPRLRGLLDDQIHMAAAHMDAYEATGNIVYRMMAEELVLFALRTMWDERDGGFIDRTPASDDVGLLRAAFKPFSTNCTAAVVLARLAQAAGNDLFARHAEAALGAMAGRAGANGVQAAEYLLAVSRVRER